MSRIQARNTEILSLSFEALANKMHNNWTPSLVGNLTGEQEEKQKCSVDAPIHNAAGLF